MTKNILLPVGITALLICAFYFYRLNTNALNAAAGHVKSISLEHYTFRGMSQKKPQNSENTSLRADISKADILFSTSPKNAAAKYEALLRQDPGNISLHLRLGMIYLKLQQTDAAKEHFYFVHEHLDSGLQPDAAWFLGLIAVLEEERTEAKDFLLECIAKKCSYRREAEELMELM